METFATISTFLTHDDIAKASPDPTQPQQTPILNLVSDAQSKGYHQVCIPLTTENWQNRWKGMCLMPSEAHEGERNTESGRRAESWRASHSFFRDEVTITRLDEAERLTVMVSHWLELDAADDWVRHDAEIALEQELAYASYLNVQTAILPPPRNRAHVASYARIVNSCLNKIPYLNLSIRLPIYNPTALQGAVTSPASPAFGQPRPFRSSSISSISTTGSGLGPRLIVSETDEPSTSTATSDQENGLESTWEMWDVIRTICDYSTRLTLALDLTPALPTTLGVLNKWMAESVRYIYLPASTFIANTKGYPVLPKVTQSFLRDTMIHRPTLILAGVNTGLHSRGGEAAYSQYIRHLEKTSPVSQAVQRTGTVENFAHGYQDFLQAPLQPLMDNLHSATYQTFEQDPVKYQHYEEAMFRALADWEAEGKVIFCVAGAGRGPLIARCLIAAVRARRDVIIFAIEKNPNAYVTLQDRKQREWGDNVTLIFGDMRQANVPELVDILVTELLGSFGDNELSPECLDGAVRFLKPNGISIPSSYSAHLAPLSSSKLYNEARAGKDVKSLETPYVVMFQAVNILSGNGGGIRGKCGSQIQECWEFEHPRRETVLDARGLPPTNSHNARSAELTFHIPHAGILHGLAGYFEAVLYKTVGLSIHPQRKDQVSKDMLSWFPLFFPFKDPLYLPSNSELRVCIWRLTNERQIWYEWHAESFLTIIEPVTPSNDSLLMSPMTPGFWSLGVSSPLLDAVDSPSRNSTISSRDGREGGGGYRLVKIGQTSLHNPDGRSSWIGL